MCDWKSLPQGGYFYVSDLYKSNKQPQHPRREVETPSEFSTLDFNSA